MAGSVRVGPAEIERLLAITNAERQAKKMAPLALTQAEKNAKTIDEVFQGFANAADRIGDTKAAVALRGARTPPKGTAAAERAKNNEKGIPESPAGPSGKPKIHVVEHSTQRQAKDAARAEVGKGGTTVKQPSPQEGGPHYHGQTQQGEKSRVHHEYPE